MIVDVWLYGVLRRYGGKAAESSFANLKVELDEGSTMADLLKSINMPTEERGVTFISGELSAMPGLQPDLGHVLREGDRIGFFDLRSMWPFQYRHGASMTKEMRHAMDDDRGHSLHTTYER